MENKKVFFISSMHFFLDSYMGFFAIYLVIARLDPMKAALIATVTTFVGNILQPLMGYTADRVRGKLPLFIGLLLTSISMSFIGLTLSYPILLILVLVGNIGTSFFHPAGANISSAVGNTKQDRSFAIFSTLGTVGYSLSQPIFSGFTGRFGTQNSFYMAFPTIFLAFVYLFYGKIKIHGPENEFILGKFKNVLSKQSMTILLLFSIMVFRSAFVMAMVTFLAKTFDQWGFSRTVYSTVVPVFMLAGALGILVAGHITHILRPRKQLFLTLTAFLPFFVLFLFFGKSGRLVPSLIFLALSGFLIQGGHAANIVMGHRVLPEMTSTISGVLMGFAWAVSSFGPTVCAFTTDAVPAFPGLASGLLILAALPIIASILSLFLSPVVDGQSRSIGGTD
jgi:FSR family fosmidomycin resistance protein-like MFS transporter